MAANICLVWLMMSYFSWGLAKGEDGGRRVALKWGAPPTELCLERPFRVVHVYLSCEWIWGQAMRGHDSHRKGGHRRNPVWKKLLALGYCNVMHAKRGTISWSREGGVGLVSCFSNRDRLSRGGVGKFVILITCCCYYCSTPSCRFSFSFMRYLWQTQNMYGWFQARRLSAWRWLGWWFCAWLHCVVSDHFVSNFSVWFELGEAMQFTPGREFWVSPHTGRCW